MTEGHGKLEPGGGVVELTVLGSTPPRSWATNSARRSEPGRGR